MKRQTVNKLLNNCHKAFVYTCIGVTVYGLVVLGLRFKRFLIEERPQIKEKEEREKLLLLQEGKDIGLPIIDVAPDMQV